MAKDLSITLSHDRALVLFEWLSRTHSTGTQDIQDQSEQRVLWDLEAELESELAEPLQANYDDLLAAARSRVRDPSG